MATPKVKATYSLDPETVDMLDRVSRRWGVSKSESFLIRALAPGSHEDAVLRRWLRAGESLAVGAVGWTEFLCGPVASAAIEAALELVGDPVPYGAPEATLAAKIFNETGRRRGSIVGCMIAASAMAADAALATSNLKHIRRLEVVGLRVASLDA